MLILSSFSLDPEHVRGSEDARLLFEGEEQSFSVVLLEMGDTVIRCDGCDIESSLIDFEIEVGVSKIPDCEYFENWTEGVIDDIRHGAMCPLSEIEELDLMSAIDHSVTSVMGDDFSVFIDHTEIIHVFHSDVSLVPSTLRNQLIESIPESKANAVISDISRSEII